MTTVVFLNGTPGCGKDTVAEMLWRHHGFSRLKFAQPLRNAWALGLWHEPPRISRRRQRRRARISTFLAMALIVAVFAGSLAAWQAMHPTPTNVLAGRVER